MNVLGVIPARGGSKRLKDKNILNVGGKPLIGHTIEAALRSKLLDRVVVSTDSDAIKRVAEERYGIEVITRPVKFAKDDSPIEEALLHAVTYMQKKKRYNTDIVVWMQANVPIREQGIVDVVVTTLINSDADSCVTCREADQAPEAMKAMDANGMLVSLSRDIRAIRKQEFPVRYLLDGSVVALRVKNLLKTKGIRKRHIYLGKNVMPVIQKKREYSLEIDEPDDVPIAEYYMSQAPGT